jgi:hypothetical protein
MCDIKDLIHLLDDSILRTVMKKEITINSEMFAT